MESRFFVSGFIMWLLSLKSDPQTYPLGGRTYTWVTLKEKQRERKRETQRERETDRQTEIEREIETEREAWKERKKDYLF